MNGDIHWSALEEPGRPLLQCCARGARQLYTRAAGLAFPPPRPLEQWCQGFYCPTPGLVPSAMPSSCLGDLNALLRRRGAGERKKRSLMGQQGAKVPSCPRAVYLQSPRQAWQMFPAATDANGINAAPIFGSQGE